MKTNEIRERIDLTREAKNGWWGENGEVSYDSSDKTDAAGRKARLEIYRSAVYDARKREFTGNRIPYVHASKPINRAPKPRVDSRKWLDRVLDDAAARAADKPYAAFDRFAASMKAESTPEWFAL